MIIFALETSCDETSAAVLSSSRGDLKLLSNIVFSQIDIHKQYGGVVPEVAARHHIQNVIPVVAEALQKAKIKPSDIDLLAVTTGPGLVTSLIIGVETAKVLSFAWKKPLLAVNHMYSHIAANFYGNKIQFPAVCLVVSGGHTEIIHLKNYRQYKKIGATIDDAAGEAFDKVAKLLGLGYPGGPAISVYAEKFTEKMQFPNIKLPRPMINSKDFNFSFSGLKTAVLYASDKIRNKDENYQIAMSHYFQEAAIDVLVSKTIRAAKKLKVKTVLMAGGVAANKKLRETLRNEAEKNGYKFIVPEFKLCTDNAAMVAVAAYYLSEKKKVPLNSYEKIKTDCNWELK
ncbi:MAG: tRNA (adenosine(37)-N6)-threonylcarbamoyltransferase complex transferase subunit TsaD [Candidatus Buchananbacteria bacterium]|jgi:N6-L-threonylcarbamoyladenine synthase